MEKWWHIWHLTLMINSDCFTFLPLKKKHGWAEYSELDTSLLSLQLFGVKVSPFYQHLPLKYWLLSRDLLDWSSVTKRALLDRGLRDRVPAPSFLPQSLIFSFLTCQTWALVSTGWFTRSRFTASLWIQVSWSWIKCSFAIITVPSFFPRK